jgi:phospholipid-translocating ATPase
VTYVLNKDISEEGIMKNPKLYAYSRKGYYMNSGTLILWVLRAVYQACIILVVTLYAYRRTHNIYGYVMDYWTIGTVVYTSLIIIQAITISLETNYWTIIHYVVIIGSFLLYPIITFIIGFIPLFSVNGVDDMYYVFIHLVIDPHFYLVVVITVALAILPVIFVQGCYRVMYEDDIDKLRKKEFKERLLNFFKKKIKK